MWRLIRIINIHLTPKGSGPSLNVQYRETLQFLITFVMEKVAQETPNSSLVYKYITMLIS